MKHRMKNLRPQATLKTGLNHEQLREQMHHWAKLARAQKYLQDKNDKEKSK